ncbi:MAG: flagella synthesis protein FlgN [Gammaproteobacteria bacterium]|nr:flagella synthesis protein FlgN [Gammaproteobacteria bacterium]
MDPNVCREHLTVLLADEISTLAQLEDLLKREHDVLGSQDVAALEKTARARQERVGALARIEEQRRSLCSMHGHSPDLAGLERMMAWCDPTGSLVSRLRECSQRAGTCRDLNDRNGSLVTAKLKRVEGLLGILTGRADKADTYGPRGAAAAARPGRVLGAA